MASLAEEFPEIVRKRLEALNSSAYAEERKADLPADAIRNIMRAGDPHGPRLARLQEVCDALGLDLYIGEPGAGRASSGGPIPDDFAAIPHLEAVLSAGPGAEPSNGLVEHLAFRRDWLYRIGVRADKAAIVSVRGDSMSPTLDDGDLVLVDGGPTEVRPRRVYAFTDLDGQLRVKRLEPINATGELVLRSDNTEAPLEVRRGADVERIHIHGEVVWSARTWRQC